MSTTEMLSRRLRELREAAGLSQAQLAEELSVSRGSISYYENGDRTPDVDFLMKAKTYFEVDYEYLLGESAIKNHRDRTSIEVAMETLTDSNRNEVFLLIRKFIDCAKLYERTENSDLSWFFGSLIGDITTYIDAYKDIPYDLIRYDERTTVLRFMDKIVHTNALDTIYRVSRLKLLDELQRDRERNQ